MKDKLMGLVITAVLLEVTLIIVVTILAIVGVIKLTNGCMLRYPSDASTTLADAAQSSITLKANGNYSSPITSTSSGQVIQSPGSDSYGNTYGQWVNTGVTATKGNQLHIQVSGFVSLCKAYLPQNNVECGTHSPNSYCPTQNGLTMNGVAVANDMNGAMIAIPRIEEGSQLQLLFNAKTPGWSNLAYLSDKDEVQVTILPNKSGANGVNVSATSFLSVFQSAPLTPANCSEGQQTYRPVCGRYSVYPNGTSYVASCSSSSQQVNYIQGYGSGYDENLYAYCTAFDGSGTCLSTNTSSSNCCVAVAGTCRDGCTGVHSRSNNINQSIWTSTIHTMPEPYLDSGTYTYPRTTAGGVINPNSSLVQTYGSEGSYFALDVSGTKGANNIAYSATCESNGPTINEQSKYFWFTANDAIGLYQQFSTTSDSLITASTDASVSTISTSDLAITNISASSLVLMNTTATGKHIGYLQYRFMTNQDNSYADNTGGYILGISQTACRVSDGGTMSALGAAAPIAPASVMPQAAFTDGYIGNIHYLILPSGLDPNAPNVVLPPISELAPHSLETLEGSASLSFTEGSTTVMPTRTGTMWMKISNDNGNYPDSFGQYVVKVGTVTPVGKFSSLVLNRVLVQFKSMMKSAGQSIFQNLTCYGNPTPNLLEGLSSNSSSSIPYTYSCTNFFSYIKAMLTLYVMIFGMMFLLGMVEIKNEDLVIRVVKIGIVAGLMNGETLHFFQNYIFDFVSGFSDEMIANIAGYATNTIDAGGDSTQNISNPFLFLDDLMSRVFFSKTFFSQVLALFALGIYGIFYFIIVFIALVALIITVFRAIAVYMLAYMAVSMLLGLAPLFLTFILFEKTYYLFENWMRHLVRYMIEPVILMAGIVIMTQLFTIYLDYVLGYSVCWKCGIVIKIPFLGLPGFDLFQGLALFCINWFTPWGLDNSGASGLMGMNMQHMVALVMIAYCMYGYTDISGSLVGRLTNTPSAPSMTSAGQSMTSSFGQKMLQQVGMDKEARGERAKEQAQRASHRRAEVKKLLEPEKPKKPEKPKEPEKPKDERSLKMKAKDGLTAAGNRVVDTAKYWGGRPKAVVTGLAKGVIATKDGAVFTAKQVKGAVTDNKVAGYKSTLEQTSRLSADSTAIQGVHAANKNTLASMKDADAKSKAYSEAASKINPAERVAMAAQQKSDKAAQNVGMKESTKQELVAKAAEARATVAERKAVTARSGAELQEANLRTATSTKEATALNLKLATEKEAFARNEYKTHQGGSDATKQGEAEFLKSSQEELRKASDMDNRAQQSVDAITALSAQSSEVAKQAEAVAKTSRAGAVSAAQLAQDIKAQEDAMPSDKKAREAAVKSSSAKKSKARNDKMKAEFRAAAHGARDSLKSGAKGLKEGMRQLKADVKGSVFSVAKAAKEVGRAVISAPKDMVKGVKDSRAKASKAAKDPKKP